MANLHPIIVQAIDHVVIRAVDHEALIAFYTDVLNCTLEREVSNLGLYQLRAGNALIDIVDACGELGRKSGSPPDRSAPNMDHLCLQIDPWDGPEILAHLRKHGFEAVDIVTRYGARGNGPSIYISDPEGNNIELKGPPELI